MYSTETYKKPFWAENSGFMTGRDPLGVQNSSITTYGRLLPGMTNLTLRLRYYGLYLWLLNMYGKDSTLRHEGTLNEHYNFIRRAELIVAFIMREKFPDELSIVGSDFTAKHQEDLIMKGFYNIHLGADKNKDTVKGSVYWDYPSGALGQYYAGSLIALNLIEIESKFFIVYQEGLQLANAFASGISLEKQNRFLQIIKTGRLTEDDINFLSDFSINNIKVDSEEWSCYNSVLLNKDGREINDINGHHTSLRKETIGLYLKYISTKTGAYEERSFITSQYKLNLLQKEGDASFGWYYYYVNEAFHIALETIFWSILIHLDGNDQEVVKFIKDISQIVIVDSIKNFSVTVDQTVFDVWCNNETKDLVELLDELEQVVKSPVNSEIAIVMAFKLMFVIYEINEKRIDELEEFEKKYKVWGQKGRVTENLNVYMRQSLDMSFELFIEETIKKLINDHVNTAYRKMGNGESNLLKFIIEDGVISHVQTMKPRHTSPRLKTVSNFMQDLFMIDKENNLTVKGMELLESI
ncbi:hypothetical protein [Ancylomarina longa]|uniref:Uncharacterized protein n=1 Tax=Ancylomarina longa TaxID=2487017 RepID=A0A434AWT4_9BACT|nr:hypothetical protein [Ancylomarina longa]RUT78952.1 hypothetical protein DLK05_05575 [Ancylomarina longa]